MGMMIFDPDYLRLGAVRRALGNVPTVALTATATPEVQDDIAATLGIGPAQRFITGFDRSNLQLEVRRTSKDAHKIKALLSSANQPETVAGVEPDQTLVYCATRTNVERVTQTLETMALLRVCTMRVWRCPIESLFKRAS